jgi:hemolysin activation/secretion protein
MPAHGTVLRNFMALSLLVASIAVACDVHAQVRPDAGQTLESVRPPPPISKRNSEAALPVEQERPALGPTNTYRIPVLRWLITGAEAFPPEELRLLLQDRVGLKLTLDELNAAAARITAYYRKHGYLLARAYVPAQKIRNNEVEITILEGHLAAINIDNTSKLNATLVNDHVDRIDTSGPVRGRQIERSLLLLNDLPGVEVRSTLQPGATVGTSDLDLQLRPTQSLDGSIDADNYGNRYTGDLRAGGTLNVNSPFHRGDQFSLRANTAGSGMTYGRAAWQTPIGGDGLYAGISWSDLRYELGENFKGLDADGDAQVGTIWTAYSWVRTQTNNLSARLSYDNKRLDDRIGATSSNSRKSLDVITLGISGDYRDPTGGNAVTSYRVELIGGRLRLDSQSAAIDQGTGGHDTEGSYQKLALSVSRSQRLDPPQLLLYAALSGQVTTKNLDSSEKQSIGGAYGVRAYPQGEATGDDAAVLNLELRWQLPGLREVQALVFADAATVWANHSTLATDGENRRTLFGEGIGGQWQKGNSFAAKTYVAWRSGPQPTSDKDRQPRFWLQLAQYF